MKRRAIRFRSSTLQRTLRCPRWKWAFGLYVSRALPYLKLYGAIGLIPLFLFWLYLNWLIVLFGLEIAFTLQAMKGRAFERRDPRGALGSADPQWLLPVMAAIFMAPVSCPRRFPMLPSLALGGLAGK